MLGEIRDHETAQMSIRAALTGHLVFSTIHTNSAFGTISRLLDMEIPPYLLANTLNLSMAQRLVRILCPHCKKETQFDPSTIPVKFPTDFQKHFLPVGCEYCLYTGYSGRKAIYELIPVNDTVREMIRQNDFKEASGLGISSLKDAALRIFYNGDTSLEEILSYLL